LNGFSAVAIVVERNIVIYAENKTRNSTTFNNKILLFDTGVCKKSK